MQAIAAYANAVLLRSKVSIKFIYVEEVYILVHALCNVVL